MKHLDFTEIDSLEFARCQRPNGSFYGTSGVCRSGVAVGAKEKLAGGEALEKFKGTETVARLTARNEELRERAKKNPDEADLIKTQLEKNNKILDKYKNNTAVLDGIVANTPEGTRVSISDKGAVVMEYTTRSGQEIKAVFGNKDYNFQVNGGYDAGTVTSRPQQIEVANAVRRNFEAVVKSLPQGAVIGTAAWTEDGRGPSRAKAYERMGFSKPVGGPGGNQYSKKSGGRMVPSNQTEEGLDKTYSFGEKSSKMSTALWHVAIFGALEKSDFTEVDSLDFTRCQRANGTFYGTSGVCRRGTKVGAKEMKALKKAAAGGNKKAKVALDVVEGKKGTCP